MQRTSVISSNINSIGYDIDNQTLEIEFNNSGIYQYNGVSAGIYNSLISAASIGSYFANNIKNQFNGIKIS